MTHRSELLLAAPPAEDAGEVARELIAEQQDHRAYDYKRCESENQQEDQMDGRIGQYQGQCLEIGHSLLRHLPVPGGDEETSSVTAADRDRVGTFGSHPTGRREQVASSTMMPDGREQLACVRRRHNACRSSADSYVSDMSQLLPAERASLRPPSYARHLATTLPRSNGAR